MFSGIKIIPRDEVRDDSSEEEEAKSKSGKDGRRRKNKDIDRKESRRAGKKIVKGGDGESDDDELIKGDVVRKSMGLDWMLPPTRKADPNPTIDVEEKTVEEVAKVNPKELNPHFKGNGTGFPEQEPEKRHGRDQLLPTCVVGDGGASWRMKLLKRAKEHAARNGHSLEEVVGERYGSLGDLVESVSSQRAAPSRAHLHAINNRRRVNTEEDKDKEKKPERVSEKGNGRDYLKDDSPRHRVLRAPKTDPSLSWGKRKAQTQRQEDSKLISEAASHLNKFSNDGNFMKEVLSTREEGRSDVERTTLPSSETNKDSEWTLAGMESLSVNQLAAKALQLRLKGKVEEAQKLTEEAERLRAKQAVGDDSSKEDRIRSASRYDVKEM
ncbi:unnamed protein product [Microthlaspi erraticum]|uniref:CWF19-like protein 2 n=1 Tax=Microthlaspi erraticum TaxID=1685480 RepID=A0A6D2JH44_9BRAS|nr:unnamed protein product [Microthlaspi erraticum]CAA7061566.1 unnamed protein product [Microthlaspi erraticum]